MVYKSVDQESMLCDNIKGQLVQVYGGLDTTNEMDQDMLKGAYTLHPAWPQVTGL